MGFQLTKFALNARGGVIDWRLSLKGEIGMGIFRSLCTLSSLKSLRISNFRNLDESLVAELEAVQRDILQELAFTNVSLWPPYESTTKYNPIRTPNSHLLRVDIRRIHDLHRFLRAMGIPLPPVSPYPFVTLTRLRNLVISGDNATEAIWEFILGVAHTLETLEIEEVSWRSELLPVHFPRAWNLTSFEPIFI
jgi:hypothetical protein